ncbi:metallophosphoesterase [Thalassotalea sp. G2M2-11]|uniref:metallophosphoesterase n=1 Tax=Thalassotalea sp. G2M2-11 TaxID=2787627 RepID=UPI0019D2434B|nr:metallophosphoesterase [Thalassotalea sp. G2M2-11]
MSLESCQSTQVIFAQISDSHLYAKKSALHHGANVYQNLCDVLIDIAQQADIQFIVFTGDLTQDHSPDAYQNFVDAVAQAQIKIPVYYLAGNHDEQALLDQYLSGEPFCQQKQVLLAHWQLHLLNSKSDTPAGFITLDEMNKVQVRQEQGKWQMMMMHHHACDVDYFIDRHGLLNKMAFYSWLAEMPKLKGLACGHVHNAMELTLATSSQQLPLWTCPATSIQFNKHVDGVANANLGAGYRRFTLCASGEVSSQAVFLVNDVPNGDKTDKGF